MSQPIDPWLLNTPDAVCFEDVDQLGAECTSDLEVLEQDVFHILIEVQGTNIDVPDRGIDIESVLSGTEPDLLTLTHQIDAQLKEDDRIEDSKTSISLNSDLSYDVDISITVDGKVYALPFAFTQGALVFRSGRLVGTLTPASDST